MWDRKGLYALAVVTALFGLLFTMVAGSIGAELTVGQSVTDPVYKALGISWRTLLLQPLDIEVTVALMIVGILLVFLFPSRRSKPT